LQRAYQWSNWHPRYKYWLYKYDIDYESKQRGSDQGDQARSSLRKLFKESAVTLDHIVPHQLEWKALSETKEQDNDIESWKDDDRKQAEDNWEAIEKTIDGIGNLLLLSRSNNASLQNCAPADRAGEYERLKLKSVSYKEVATWKRRSEWREAKNDPWQARIEARGKRLLSWVQEYFTEPATWREIETT
jgi:hypothetical protein